MSGNRGWFRIYRQIFSWRFSPTQKKRPFTEFEAWIWMIARANHDTGVYGREVIERGQFTTSREALAKAWRWSESKVYRYLRDLSSPIRGENGEQIEPEIEQQTNSRRTRITIRNYWRYQDTRTADEQPTEQPADSRRTADEQPVNTNNKEEEEEEGLKEGVKSALTDPQIGIRLLAMQEYFQMQHDAYFAGLLGSGFTGWATENLIKPYLDPIYPKNHVSRALESFMEHKMERNPGYRPLGQEGRGDVARWVKRQYIDQPEEEVRLRDLSNPAEY